MLILFPNYNDNVPQNEGILPLRFIYLIVSNVIKTDQNPYRFYQLL